MFDKYSIITQITQTKIWFIINIQLSMTEATILFMDNDDCQPSCLFNTKTKSYVLGSKLPKRDCTFQVLVFAAEDRNYSSLG